MHSNRLAGILAVLCAMPSAALAQQQEEEIVVVGKYLLYGSGQCSQNTNAHHRCAAKPFQLITADQITLQGFTSIGDIINYTPRRKHITGRRPP